MRALFQKLVVWFFLAMTAVAVPATASAQDEIRLNGKDAWDLYVHGNGEAIAQILTAVKLMIAPDEGGGAFRYLLLFLAIAGFIVLAVRAGFDPGKNFLKMFGFIFMIWLVMYGTTGARAHVHIYDRMSGYSNVITGVPALVAIPASIVSQTGEWLTRQIEQNFAIPGALKMSEGGQYNLFSKVLSDMNQFVISDQDLSRSLKAYVSDCVVPAMALGRVSAQDLYRSAVLVDTLEKAALNAILTRYYAPRIGQPEPPPGTPTNPGALGEVMPCVDAFNNIKADLEVYAEALLDATNQQWEASGIMVPFEQVMSEAMAQSAAAGGGNPMSRYGRAQGVILQKALAAHLYGDFREAAVRTGNNELMMATSLAQAEQSQKSSWSTAAEIFKNMMGYVYLVLQAFIFAIVPVILIGLMIPGLGGKIFTNYFQILVWLMMWAPMLAIVSFLVTIFGGAQLRGTLGIAGLTMENAGVIVESANNLVIAAQFIGTMVPLITWGIVKGAMAFTEFVSHGIGSSFATQAGAQAATGNVSMGNMSMDNVGMNKYSTTMTSAVGQQAVIADYAAGKGLAKHDQGGTSGSAHGQNLTPKVSQNLTETVTLSRGWSNALGREVTAQEMTTAQRMAETSQAVADSLANVVSALEAHTRDRSTDLALTDQEQAQLTEALNQLREINDAFGSAAKIGAEVGWESKKQALGWIINKLGGLKLGVAASADFNTVRQHAEKLAEQAQAIISQSAQRAQSYKEGESASESSSRNYSHTLDSSLRQSINESRSSLESATEARKEHEQYMDALQVALTATVSRSQDIAEAYTGLTFEPGRNIEGGYVDAVSEIDRGQRNIEQRAGGVRQQVGNLNAEVGTAMAAANEALDTAAQGVQNAAAERQRPSEFQDGKENLDAARERLNAAYERRNADAEGRGADVRAGIEDFNALNAVGGSIADMGSGAYKAVKGLFD